MWNLLFNMRETIFNRVYPRENRWGTVTTDAFSPEEGIRILSYKVTAQADEMLTSEKRPASYLSGIGLIVENRNNVQIEVRLPIVFWHCVLPMDWIFFVEFNYSLSLCVCAMRTPCQSSGLHSNALRRILTKGSWSRPWSQSLGRDPACAVCQNG